MSVLIPKTKVWTILYVSNYREMFHDLDDERDCAPHFLYATAQEAVDAALEEVMNNWMDNNDEPRQGDPLIPDSPEFEWETPMDGICLQDVNGKTWVVFEEDKYAPYLLVYPMEVA